MKYRLRVRPVHGWQVPRGDLIENGVRIVAGDKFVIVPNDRIDDLIQLLVDSKEAHQ